MLRLRMVSPFRVKFMVDTDADEVSSIYASELVVAAQTLAQQRQ